MFARRRQPSSAAETRKSQYRAQATRQERTALEGQRQNVSRCQSACLAEEMTDRPASSELRSPKQQHGSDAKCDVSLQSPANRDRTRATEDCKNRLTRKLQTDGARRLLFAQPATAHRLGHDLAAAPQIRKTASVRSRGHPTATRQQPAARDSSRGSAGPLPARSAARRRRLNWTRRRKPDRRNATSSGRRPSSSRT